MITDFIEIAANIGKHIRYQLIFRHGHRTLYRVHHIDPKDGSKLISRRFQHLRIVHLDNFKYHKSVLVASCTLFPSHFLRSSPHDCLSICTIVHFG